MIYSALNEYVKRPIVLLLFMLFSGFVEIFSISLLIPVSSLLVDSSAIDNINANIISFLSIFSINGNVQIVTFLIVIVFILSFLSFLVAHYLEIYILRLKFSGLSNLRSSLASSYLNSDWHFLSEVKSGKIVNYLNHESERAIESIFALVTLASLFIVLVFYIILSFFISYKMTILTILILLITYFFSVRLSKRIKSSSISNIGFNSLYSGLIVEVFTSIRFLKVMNFTEHLSKLLQSFNISSCNDLERIGYFQSLMRFQLQSFILLSILSVFLISFLIIELPIESLLVFLFILLRMLPKVSSLQGIYNSFIAHSESLKAILQLRKKLMHRPLNVDSVVKFPIDIISSLKFSSVSFSYNTNNNFYLLNALDLEIKKPSLVALVGKSGSGKSTIIDLICTLINPTQGSYYINSIDTKMVEKKSFIKNIGFLPQANNIYNASLRDNILMGRSYTDEQIFNAIGLSQLTETISHLPDGLNTNLGTGGVILSGGELQRLGLARALLGKPSLLILDEPTSALDSNNETAILNTICSLKKDIIIILVTHNEEILSSCDCVYKIENNTIEKITKN